MTTQKFQQLDTIRFFAILFVLIGHWPCSFGGYLEKNELAPAARGVELFFVLSGFLITIGLIRANESGRDASISLRNFYAKRFLRIFPLYYLTLLLLWFFNHKKVADGIIWYLLYGSNFYSIKNQAWGGMGHLWSLAVEEQFYCFWPLLILFIPARRTIWVILAAIGLSIATKIFWYCQHYSFWISYMHPLGAMDILGMGALLAYCYHYYPSQLKALLNDWRLAAILLVQLLLCILSLYSTHYSFIHDNWYRTSFGLVAAWLVGKGIFGFEGSLRPLMESRALGYLGKISYGIYLFHALVPGMLMGLTFPESINLRFVMYFILTIAISSLSWEIFESRVLKLKARFE